MMKKIKPMMLLRLSVCALALSMATQASASLYQVRMDTSTLAGSGWLDLQFNPGPNTAPAAGAVLSGFRGALNGPAVATGEVSGDLPGTVVFGNGASYNDLFQAVMLGGPFSFLLEFDGPFSTDISSSGSTFALSLYGDDQITPLGNPDASGSLLRFELLPASLAAVGGVTVVVADPGIASVNAIPEPATMSMIALGLLSLAVAARRTRRS